jgi:hypothetical protein
LQNLGGLWAIALLSSAGPAIIVKSWQEATFSHARMEYIQVFHIKEFQAYEVCTFNNFWPILQPKGSS